MKATLSSKIEFSHKIRNAELADWLVMVPRDADITVNKFEGDQRDPGYVTLTATWLHGSSSD